MVKVPDSSTIAKRYNDAISGVPSSYKDAVSKTTGVIAAGVAAEGLYAQKVQESIASGRRAKALAKVTDSEWQAKASSLGASRIGPGMTANSEKRTRNYEPYRAELGSIELAPRTADPMTNVTNRVGAIAVRLAEKKKELLG